MMNCIAIDDEPLALSLLADNISKIPYLNLIAVCEDGFTANIVLQENNIDLIFIDIQMPGITGIQLVNSLIKKPLVIIVSAYKQYAVEGFALSAVDYLMKPVPVDRFIQACNKAKEFFELRATKHKFIESAIDHTFINTGYSLLRIDYNEILYLEGLKDYVRIHFSGNKKPAVARISFKNIEKKWPEYFMRIQKSYIINSRKIEAINKSSIIVAQNELPIGEAFRPSITAFVESYSR